MTQDVLHCATTLKNIFHCSSWLRSIMEIPSRKTCESDCRLSPEPSRFPIRICIHICRCVWVPWTVSASRAKKPGDRVVSLQRCLLLGWAHMRTSKCCSLCLSRECEQGLPGRLSPLKWDVNYAEVVRPCYLKCQRHNLGQPLQTNLRCRTSRSGCSSELRRTSLP